jgi:hypothetical protein
VNTQQVVRLTFFHRESTMSICIGSIFNGNRLAAYPPENCRLRGAAIAPNGSISGGAFSQGQDKLTLMENQAHLKASSFGLRHPAAIEAAW